MSFDDFQQVSRRLAACSRGDRGSRGGGIGRPSAWPCFRRNLWPEGCRPLAAEPFAGGYRPVPVTDWKSCCGKVTNRTSDLFRSVRHLHLNSYRLGTGSRPMRRPSSEPSTGWRRCSTEETKKREFQRQAQVSADEQFARDWKLLGIDRLRLVCERVQSRR